MMLGVIQESKMDRLKESAYYIGMSGVLGTWNSVSAPHIVESVNSIVQAVSYYSSVSMIVKDPYLTRISQGALVYTTGDKLTLTIYMDKRIVEFYKNENLVCR